MFVLFRYDLFERNGTEHQGYGTILHSEKEKENGKKRVLDRKWLSSCHALAQQHPPVCLFPVAPPTLTLPLEPPAPAPWFVPVWPAGLIAPLSTSFALTSRAREKNASSTWSLFFAEVSTYGIPSSLASACASSVDTTRFSVQSDLLPTRRRDTPSDACCSMFECHVRMSEGERKGWRGL